MIHQQGSRLKLSPATVVVEKEDNTVKILSIWFFHTSIKDAA